MSKIEQIARKHWAYHLAPGSDRPIWDEPAILAALRELREELAKEAFQYQHGANAAEAIRHWGEDEEPK